MSTPIYDALCEAMPGPSGPDGEETATHEQHADIGGAADQDGHGDGIASGNGRVGAVRRR